jgi:hypothetical protein
MRSKDPWMSQTMARLGFMRLLTLELQDNSCNTSSREKQIYSL